jgi:hypothetical protein
MVEGTYSTLVSFATAIGSNHGRLWSITGGREVILSFEIEHLKNYTRKNAGMKRDKLKERGLQPHVGVRMITPRLVCPGAGLSQIICYRRFPLIYIHKANVFYISKTPKKSGERHNMHYTPL